MTKKTRAGRESGRQISKRVLMEWLTVGLSGDISLLLGTSERTWYGGKVITDLHNTDWRGLRWEIVLFTVGSDGVVSRA